MLNWKDVAGPGIFTRARHGTDQHCAGTATSFAASRSESLSDNESLSRSESNIRVEIFGIS